MWLIKIFSAIYFTAVCALQDPQDELPEPTLQLRTLWLDVFPSEKVEFKCSVAGSSDWTFTWSRNGAEVQDSDSNVSLSEEGSVLTLTAAQIYSGSYTCKARHKTKAIFTAASNSLELKVSSNNLKPTLKKSGNLDIMFVGENITFTCTVDVSFGWEFLWYHNGTELQAHDNTYTIASIDHLNGGAYYCKAKRGKGPFYTEESETIVLQVSDWPKPSLRLLTSWSDVFQNESLEFMCDVEGSDWSFTWYKNEVQLQEDSVLSLSEEEPSLNITLITQAYQGGYACKVNFESRVIPEFSNTVSVTVYENIPKPTVSKDPSFNLMYVGEMVKFKCNVKVSSGWEFIWYKDGKHLSETNETMSIRLGSSDGGKYSCQATRGETTLTEISEEIPQAVLEIPVPSLTLMTAWVDVFPDETVKMKCGLDHSSDWTYTWYKDEQLVQADNVVSFDTNGATLSIHSASAAHAGQFKCKGHLNDRSFNSSSSSGRNLTVYEKKPGVTLRQDPDFKVMFPGESVSFSCGIDVSSGWEYLWYKDGEPLGEISNRITIRLNGTTHQGSYECQAIRGKNQKFVTDTSQGIRLTVEEIPVPSLTLMTAWVDVFPDETVKMRCGMDHSSDWTYTWYKDEQLVEADNVVSFDTNGATLSIHSASAAHAGQFKCKGHLNDRSVNSSSSSGRILTVYEKKPGVTLRQDPDFKVMFPGESVSFSCGIDVSSGWEYLWYKDGEPLGEISNRITIRLNGTTHQGSYECQAIRGKNQKFVTDTSQGIRLTVEEIPVPSLTLMTAWVDVFPDETVKMKCGLDHSSDWTYTWYKDEQLVQADNVVSFDTNGATLSIHSASAAHAGQFKCKGHLNDRSVNSGSSSGRNLTVYDTKPRVTLMQEPNHHVLHTEDSVSFRCHINDSSGWEFLWYKDDIQLAESGNNYTIASVLTRNTGSYKCQTKRGNNEAFLSDRTQAVRLDIKERPKADIILLTGWSEVFSTDSLVLKCGVQDTQDTWDYTWFKEGQRIDLLASEKYTVTPQNDPEQSLYSCQGIRTARPFYSKTSDQFKTKNLLLKRRVLLSVSGCLFFGIIVVFIGCIVLRAFHKPAEAEYKPEESDLFLSMKPKDSDDAPCPLVEYITDAALNASSKDGDENGTICSETTPLPITLQDDEALMTESHDATETNNGLVSFKQ